MKTLTISLMCAASTVLGAAAGASAAPAAEPFSSPRAAMAGAPAGPARLPRNGVELDNSGHPVTGQGPNMTTRTLEGILEDAGAPDR